MQTIGDRLEEARKRQGISVREAAEATKIRGDFLLGFENNNFDFDLPEVYRKGFLKLYAQFLKLDTEKIITDYHAVILGTSSHAKRESREVFGRMDLPESQPTIGGSQAEPPIRSPHATHPQVPSGEETTTKSGGGELDVSLYWKIGLVVLGTVAAAVLIGLLISALVSSSPEEDVDTPAVVDGNGELLNEELPVIDDVVGEVILVAQGDVGVVVKQKNDDRYLFRGSLESGETLSLNRVGPVSITCEDLHKLVVRVDGRDFRFDDAPPGPGRRVIN